MQNPHFQKMMQGIEVLTIFELEELMKQILQIRKQKLPTVPSDSESELLRKINAPLPKTIQRRYISLLKKRKAETLTALEYDELLDLTSFHEAKTAKRLAYLVELAKIRKQTLDEVLVALQIKPSVYVISRSRQTSA